MRFILNHQNPPEDGDGLLRPGVLDGLVSVEDVLVQHPPAVAPPLLCPLLQVTLHVGFLATDLGELDCMYSHACLWDF